MANDALQLQIKLDYPVKSQFVKLPSKATFADLKAECVKLFDLKAEDVNRHEFRSVSFGQNVFELAGKPDSTALSEFGVQTRSLVFLTAPTDLKPAPERKKKKKEGDEEEDAGEEEKDKYVGLKSSTLLKHMASKLSAKELTTAQEYFDIQAAKVMKTPEWLTLDEKKVAELVQRKGISCKEVDVFDGVIAWGKEQCKNTKKDPTPDNLRTVLKDILPHVRFPCMTMEEIATKVTPSQILTGDQTLSIFTYLGSSKDKQKSMKLAFPTKPREPRRPANYFTWSSAHKHYSVTLSDKDMVATSTDPNSWQNLGGSQEFSKGVIEYEVTLTQYDSANGHNVLIGFVPSSFTNWSYNSYIGSSSTVPGWAFVTGNGYKSSQNTGMTYYGSACSSGTVIKAKCDLKAHTIEFFQNSRSLGVAFTDVYGPVRPAISLIRNQKVTLKFPKA